MVTLIPENVTSIQIIRGSRRRITSLHMYETTLVMSVSRKHPEFDALLKYIKISGIKWTQTQESGMAESLERNCKVMQNYACIISELVYNTL